MHRVCQHIHNQTREIQMTDIVITAIAPTANTVIARGICGVVISSAKAVYADATDSNKIKLALAPSGGGATVATAAVVGLTLNITDTVGQPIEYATGGDVTVTVTGNLTPGKVYVLGANAGGISLSADLDAASNRYGTIMGVATSTTNLRLSIMASGVLKV
jgi:hypothetical protein